MTYGLTTGLPARFLPCLHEFELVLPCRRVTCHSRVKSININTYTTHHCISSTDSPHELELPLRRDEGDGPVGVEFPQPHAAVERAVVKRYRWSPVGPASCVRVSLHYQFVVESELTVGHSCVFHKNMLTCTPYDAYLPTHFKSKVKLLGKSDRKNTLLVRLRV